MKQRHDILNLALGLAACFAAGCAGTRQVESTPKADVLVLTSSYSIEENLGPAPVEMTTTENLIRYRFERKKASPEFLLVLFPDLVDGAIKVKLSEGLAEAEPATYGAFFDQLLRAHRMILRGDLVGAEAVVGRITNQFDVGYGTSILGGNIALLKGEHESAVRQFSYAKSLVPDAPVPKTLEATGVQ